MMVLSIRTEKEDSRFRRAVRCAAVVSVCIMAGLPWTAAFADGIEPHDTLATACQSGLDGLGMVDITGAVLGDGDHPDLDVDIFSFSITSATPFPYASP